MVQFLSAHLVQPIAHAGRNAVDGVQAGCNRIGNAVSKAAQVTTEKTAKFFYDNSSTLLYGVSCAATAYFAPQLFIPSMIASLVVRIEVTRCLKELAKEYFRPEKDPFVHGNSRPAITTLDLAMATIAGIDALALGTLFYSSSLTANLLPMLGGLAAGSTAAKLVMNWAHRPPAAQAPQAPRPEAFVDEAAEIA